VTARPRADHSVEQANTGRRRDSSTGQVYHHLRALTSARVVKQDCRAFRVPTTCVVPVLTMMLAVAGVAGLVH
jgi:ArsR family transcriptional regulator